MANVRKNTIAKKRTKPNKLVSKGIVEKEGTRLDNALTLDELMGLSSPNLFGARTEDEFEKKIDRMPLIDMHKLATKAGLLPVHDRVMMRNRLKKAFAAYIKSMRPYKLSKNRYYSEGIETNDKVRDILSEGK